MPKDSVMILGIYLVRWSFGFRSEQSKNLVFNIQCNYMIYVSTLWKKIYVAEGLICAIGKIAIIVIFREKEWIYIGPSL
jgi:hypothetical protein